MLMLSDSERGAPTSMRYIRVKNPDDYILNGQIDLIRGNNDTVEIVDFKSEKIPEMDDEMLKRYRRQLEIYAYRA